MISEKYATQLAKAVIDLMFIIEHDTNLKDDRDYKEFKQTVFNDVEALKVYETYDRLIESSSTQKN